MSKKSKLIKRFKSLPKDFHYDEMVRLLGYYDYEEVKKGKTSGSRVRFEKEGGEPIMLHKPHPNGIMKMYQMRQVKKHLEL